MASASTSETQERGLARLAQRSAAWTEKWFPDAYVFALAGVGLDMVAMCTYGLGGAALAAQMNQPAFRRRFDVAVGLLLIAVAVLILMRG